MLLISHRGNTVGPDPENENRPEYIKSALSQGFNVEIDAWFIVGKWFLGHDTPQHETDLNFLSRNNLWVHCKNYATLQKMTSVGRGINYFYHTNEDYVLTSKNYIWAYPGKFGGANTICVLPDWYNTPVEGFAGICSDFIESYRD